MALAINIKDLLNKQRIESNRIEFKKGFNPASTLVSKDGLEANMIYLYKLIGKKENGGNEVRNVDF